MSNYFEIKSLNAKQALENRSMMSIDWYMLLLYASKFNQDLDKDAINALSEPLSLISTDPAYRFHKNTKQDVIQENHDQLIVKNHWGDVFSTIGKASFFDLTLRLPWQSFKSSMKAQWEKIKKIINDYYNTEIFSSHALGFINPKLNSWSNSTLMFIKAIPTALYLTLRVFILLPLNFISGLFMMTARVLYGALDWLSLQLAKWVLGEKECTTENLVYAAKWAVALSVLTSPIRLLAGFMEAFQEPLHLYDFWLKGFKDAWVEFKSDKISLGVFLIKELLQSFKVLCTGLAVASIAGLPILLGFQAVVKSAHYVAYPLEKAMHAASHYVGNIIEWPFEQVKYILRKIENGILNLQGVEEPQNTFSERVNAKHAFELGFESALTKNAGWLPMYRNDGIKKPSEESKWSYSAIKKMGLR